jgi:lysyl-tRNA synthetase class 2
VRHLYGTTKVKYHPDGEAGEGCREWEIDFTPPFKRLKMLPALEEAMGEKLPPADELGTPEGVKRLEELCDKHNVNCPPPRTPARLLDKVLSRFKCQILR